MLLGNLVQLSIGCMDVILIVHFLKFGFHQVLFFIHCCYDPLSRIHYGSESTQDFLVITVIWLNLKLSVRDLDERMSLKKEIRVPFRAPLFLGKWYGVTTYFSLYKKIRKITNYKIHDWIVPFIDWTKITYLENWKVT